MPKPDWNLFGLLTLKTKKKKKCSYKFISSKRRTKENLHLSSDAGETVMNDEEKA